MLRAKTPIRGEGAISFDEPSHTYTVHGKKVPISVTALGGRAVPLEHKFNGPAVINRNLTSWRSKASSKYHDLVAGVSDAQARENVLALWDRNRDAGTAMHKLFEDVLNEVAPVSAEGHEVEMAQFYAAMAEMEEVPARTELSIYAVDREGEAAVAGQIDLLTRDREGDFHIVDFKRTASDLSPGAFSFGKRFLDGKPLNDHYKYSLQLSLYSVIFGQQTGLPIESCRLLQIHPDLDGHRWIDATDLTTEARELLRDAHVAL
jgi:hypothetical protein